MKFKLFFVLLCYLISSLPLYSQVSINEDGSPPEGSAMLDVNSNDKGLLVPRMTASQRDGIASPVAGLVVYVTDENQFSLFSDGQWKSLVIADSLFWASSGDDIHTLNSGKVGIGTSNPQNQVEVYNEAGTANISIIGKTGSGASVRYENHVDDDAALMLDVPRGLKIINMALDNDADIVFRVQDSDEVLRLKGSGMIEVSGELDMNGNESRNFVIENRTSDPASPQVGQVWIRTDL